MFMDFLLKTWLHVRPSVLCYMSIACLDISIIMLLSLVTVSSPWYSSWTNSDPHLSGFKLLLLLLLVVVVVVAVVVCFLRYHNTGS
jgi:small-conductance mechanosensitive channel